MNDKYPVKFSLTMRLPHHCRVLLHAAKLQHGTDGFTFPPKEGMLRIFSITDLSFLYFIRTVNLLFPQFLVIKILFYLIICVLYRMLNVRLSEDDLKKN
jgi:hypothetical protein